MSNNLFKCLFSFSDFWSQVSQSLHLPSPGGAAVAKHCPYCLIKRLLLERLNIAPAFLLLFYVVMNALEVMFHSWDESGFLLCCTEIYAFLNTAQQYYLILCTLFTLASFSGQQLCCYYCHWHVDHLLSSMEKLVVSTVRWVES